MPSNNPSETLAQKLHITDAEVRERKALLDISPEDEVTLASFRPHAEDHVEQIVDDFYQFQLSVPSIRAVIGDRDTLDTLRRAMRDYVMDLFRGTYDLTYAEKRLRVGRIHARIGVPSKHYVAAMHHLCALLTACLKDGSDDPRIESIVSRLFLFDIGLTFDTYILGVNAHLEAARDDLARYSTSLEQVVAERTRQLEAQSRIDELTGLGNRRAFGEALDRECAAANRRGGAICLMFADLNDFKTVNDTEGHVAGDELLRKVGLVLRQESRLSDSAFRYGGDEFCLLLPETDEAGAQCLAQRLVTAIALATANRVNVSFGWSVSDSADRIPPQDLIQRADAAMYRSKQQRHQLPPAKMLRLSQGERPKARLQN